MFISQIVYVSVRFRRRYAECFISHAVIVASFFAAVETSKIIHALRLHKSCDDFIFKRNGELESWRAVELYSYCIPLGSPKVMYSSTVYVHFDFVSALFVFHSTLVVRIPTVFRHSARALLVLSSTRCMHFYVFHSMRAFYLSFLKEMESWRAGELES